MSKPPIHSDFSETIRRLRAVTRRVEAFFESQTSRIQQAMKQLNEMHCEFDAARRLSVDIDQQQSQWNSERQQELQRLAEAGEALAQGWQELESKQRELLLMVNHNENTRPANHLTAGAATQHQVSDSDSCPEISQFEIQLLQRQVFEHSKRGR